jgi:rhodanese-related sulfurtransferase
MLLQGALTLQQLEAILPTFPHDRAIYFYCACANEATSAARAQEYRQRGYRRAAAIKGGVKAWKDAGLPMAGP